MSHLVDESDDVGGLAAELERVSALLAAERAEFRAELVLGAQELERRDEVIARLKAKRDRALAQRDAARTELKRYRRSRVVRFAVRISERRARG